MPAFDDLWDFEDPSGTEARLREALQRAGDGSDPRPGLEIRTQVARALGLQQKFSEAGALLDEVERRLDGASPVVRVRWLLERGRVLNSSGHPAQAGPLFEQAWQEACECGEEALAVDAAHMAAIVSDPEGAIAWSQRALQLCGASADPAARKWKGSLLNNLAWTHHDLGNHERALALFEEALAQRERDGDAARVFVARWCVARALRSLGRAEEALAAQRALQADREAAGAPADRHVAEEIEECRRALEGSTGRGAR